MTPHGRRHVEAARADGRWDNAYAPIRSTTEATVPDDLRAAIDANPRARRTFWTLGRMNLFARARRDDARRPGGVADPIGFSRLTERQQKIVRMIGRGMNSEQIVEALGLTVWTVSFHRKNIRRALGIHNDMEMYRYTILVGSDDGNAEAGPTCAGL